MAGSTTTRSARLRFHAVTVMPCPDACPQARAVQNVRLLSAETPPRLPMAGCDRPERCDCRFRHHDDRRVGPRRRVERAMGSNPYELDERRAVRGRRDTDWPDD